MQLIPLTATRSNSPKSKICLQISYNLCNLPKQITTVNGKTVKYTYFADGTKFKAVNAAGSGFAYTGSLRWSVQNGVLTPESVAITGGRALYNDVEEQWSVNYYITDHLGSVRAVTDAEGEVLDTFDYMPYGSELTVDADNITDYRFTCKEKQLMFGNSNIYDSFARFQNTTGRFMSIDPKAESFYHISPYTYCAGDPVNLVDPNGEIIKDPDGMVDGFVEQIKHIIRDVRSANNIADDIKYQLLNAFKQTIRELRRLKRSKDIFTIVFDSTIEGGDTRWKDDGVLIRISDKTDYGLIGHELKHAYQFMEGKISFNKSNGDAGKLYDITDEEEAFKRQAYIGGVLFWKRDYDDYLKIIPIIYPNVNPENTHTKRTCGKDLSNDIYR